MGKRKFIKTYEEFSGADTSNWAPPKYLVKPADGDKGFALVKAHSTNINRFLKKKSSGDTNESSEEC